MAPLPNMERVKALGWLNNRLVAFVVATGPAGQGAPWIEQWFYFNDQDGPVYGNYPEYIPEALTSAAAAFLLPDFPDREQRLAACPRLPRGIARGVLLDVHDRLGKRSGGRANARRRTAASTNPPQVEWQFVPVSSSDFGVYHGSSPAADDPASFHASGLKNLLDQFGRSTLSGSVGYVFGETRKKPDQSSSGTSHAWIEAEGACTSGGDVSRKAVRFVVGQTNTVIGYAWSGWRKEVDSNQHRRFVHQFLKPGAALGGSRMEDLTTDHDSAQAFFNAVKGNIAVADKVDYLYGCARVWKDCNPDQDDKPQDPASYPG